MDQPDTALLDKRIGNIRLLRILGKGGMGTVYEGFDERLQRRVAVKAIRSEHRFRADVKARFLREARILSQLQHPKICVVHDSVEDEQYDFLILELVEGRNLRAAIEGGLSTGARLAIAAQLLDVLTAVHGRGVIHRDLKPENIMVGDDDRIKVLDFGLARSLEDAAPSVPSTRDGPGVPPPTGPGDETVVVAAGSRPPTVDTSGRREPAMQTVAGAILGTVDYMSPEQARGEPATPASDIYSLGLVFQELFTGQAVADPDLDPIQKLLRAAEGRTPEVRGVDPELAALIARMKSPAPGSRPSAVDAQRLLEAFIDRPRRRRRRAVVAAVWVVLILFAAGAGIQSLRAARAAREAEAQRQRAVTARHQAEDLLSFMLIDLAASLRTVGKLPLLGGVAHTALDYFQNLPQEEIDDTARRQRSQALRQVGIVLQGQGDLGGALTAFQEARRIAADLAGEGPDAEAELDLKDALDQLGMGLYGQGAHRESLEAFTEAVALAEALLARDPVDPGLLAELSFSLNAQGIVTSHLGDLEAALEYYRRSLEIRRRLAEGSPSASPERFAVATSLLNMGVLQADMGETRVAVASYDESLDILEAMLAAEPDHAMALRQKATVTNNRGAALSEVGDFEGALDSHRVSLATMERLVEHDPSNATWHRDRARSLANIGATLVDQRRYAEALAEQRRALAVYRDLADQDPSNAIWRSDVATSLNGVAVIQRNLGRVEESLRTLEEGRIWCQRAVADFPDEPLMDRNLGDVHMGRADAFELLGRTNEALAAGRQALAVRQAMVESDPAHSGWRLDRAEARLSVARSLLVLSRPTEARVAVDEAVSSLEALFAEEPERSRVRTSLATALVVQGRAASGLADHEGASTSWRRAVEVSRVDGEGADGLGLLGANVGARLMLGDTDGLQESIDRLHRAGALTEDLRALAAKRGLRLD
jgi:tetratricopeptide (TPR) repeat protein/tRNA A-37 threonylcarbamoyl transferase component Bud32